MGPPYIQPPKRSKKKVDLKMYIDESYHFHKPHKTYFKVFSKVLKISNKICSPNTCFAKLFIAIGNLRLCHGIDLKPWITSKEQRKLGFEQEAWSNLDNSIFTFP